MAKTKHPRACVSPILIRITNLQLLTPQLGGGFSSFLLNVRMISLFLTAEDLRSQTSLVHCRLEPSWSMLKSSWGGFLASSSLGIWRALAAAASQKSGTCRRLEQQHLERCGDFCDFTSVFLGISISFDLQRSRRKIGIPWKIGVLTWEPRPSGCASASFRVCRVAAPCWPAIWSTALPWWPYWWDGMGKDRGWNDGKVGKNIGQHLMSAQENHPFCTTK